MIATGGLLRINRRQDSLHSKPHKAHTQKKKNKRKRSEVVVVKGKLKLCSVSGLVAALGILVLLVGVVMAALGYWPRDGLFFSAKPQEGAKLASVSSPADAQEADRGGDKGDRGGDKGDRGGDKGDRGANEGLNQTESNRRKQQHLQSFLEEFLDRYLYSDRLKVFGPLIMGIGIFLFICGNAVLHENRDKKTKVINLRDIYSTVIDLHSRRKPTSSTRRPSANPINGLVNYVQSKSLDTKPRAYPASLLGKKEAGGGGLKGGEAGGGGLKGGEAGGGGLKGGEAGGLLRQPLPGSSNDAGGEAVFSICQEHRDASPSWSSHRLSLPPSFSPAPHSTSSFTLPLRRSTPPGPNRRSSAWIGAGGEDDGVGEGDVHEEFKAGWPLCSSTPASERPLVVPPLPLVSQEVSASCSSSSLHREAPGGSQALPLLWSSSLTPSHLSLSSLSHLLSSSSSTPPVTCRRRSLPAGGAAAGYTELSDGEEESFQSIALHHVTSKVRGQRSGEVASHRKYSNKEKLQMISQVDCGLSQDSQSETTNDIM